MRKRNGEELSSDKKTKTVTLRLNESYMNRWLNMFKLLPAADLSFMLVLVNDYRL